MNFNLRSVAAAALLAGLLVNPFTQSTVVSPVSLVETDGAKDGNGTTRASINNAVIGSAASDRVVCVAASWFSTGANISDFEIGGNNATTVINASQSGARTRISCLLVTTGTTADVDIDFDAVLSDDVAIGVFRLSGTGGSTTPTDTDNDTHSSDNRVDINSLTVATDGAALTAVAGGNDNGNSWSGAAESYDLDLGSSRGSAALTTTVGTNAISAVSSGNVPRAMAGAAWSPP